MHRTGSKTTVKPKHKEMSLARRRLRQDLLELQRDGICSVAALPLDKNIFEWHVNIKPLDGVYSGVYFHLIMQFPTDYPASPPTVQIKTPISHPNIFGSWLCLSMIKKHTATVPYEGWSGAYSVSSILMQLQSFLFAEKIDQDYGGQANAQLTDGDVSRSLSTCKTLKCPCGHSHDTPWPPVKGPPESMIKIFPTDPRSGHVQVLGSACQTTHTYWVGAYGEFGACRGRVQYEAFINWTGDKWARNNIRGGLCRFGFGTQYAVVCGRDAASFGYGGTGMFSFDNNFTKFGDPFTTKDTITVAIDFEAGTLYFAKNGQILNDGHPLVLPPALCGVPLYPMLSFKNSRAEFNFGTPLTPCSWLRRGGFRTLEEVAIAERGNFDDEGNDDGTDRVWHNGRAVDWDHEGIIPELWLSVFCGLTVQDLFAAKFVCKSWHCSISRFNISERMETTCFFTRKNIFSRNHVLGIGLDIYDSKGRGQYQVRTQMDVLSETAWNNGCRIGVWGESLTHFLPMVMNREHSHRSSQQIEKYLLKIDRVLCPPKRAPLSSTGRRGGRGGAAASKSTRGSGSAAPHSTALRLLNCLVTMMNQIVVQFVMESEGKNTGPSPVGYGSWKAADRNISMRFCEKVVVGYCALHHLLLWLQARYRSEINQFVAQTMKSFMEKGTTKRLCPDLGKFLIYLMISRRTKWHDVAPRFILEVMTRNVRWMVNDRKYRQYDTTSYLRGRSAAAFTATQTSRRLVMFQVWFMRKCSAETLGSYNDRLGRPRTSFRNAVLQKTQSILDCKGWTQYFDGLGVRMRSEEDIDQLLCFAVGNSKENGYHGRGMQNHQWVRPPVIPMIGAPKKPKNPQQKIQKVANRPNARNTTKSTVSQKEGVRDEKTPKQNEGVHAQNGGSAKMSKSGGNSTKTNVNDEEQNKKPQPKLSKAARRRLRKKRNQKGNQ